MNVNALRMIQWGRERKTFTNWWWFRRTHSRVKFVDYSFNFLGERFDWEEGEGVLEQLVAMEQGWDQQEIEGGADAAAYLRDDEDDPTSYTMLLPARKQSTAKVHEMSYGEAERKVFAGLNKQFVQSPFDVYEVVSKLTGMPREEVKRRYCSYVYGGPITGRVTITRKKGWIEVYRHFLPNSYRDIPWCWKVCIKTVNGRRLMVSQPESPRKIDAVRIAEKLAAMTGLNVRGV